MDILNVDNLRRFNIVYDNYNKINYIEANKKIRQYIWYKVVKKFSNKLPYLKLQDFKQLKNFIHEKSFIFNIMLDKYGNILNIPLELRKLIN